MNHRFFNTDYNEIKTLYLRFKNWIELLTKPKNIIAEELCNTCDPLHHRTRQITPELPFL